MSRVYSTYEAKARFSEILRQVRSGQRVRVSYHGQEVAEIRPVAEQDSSFEQRLQRLEERGVVSRAPRLQGDLEPIAKKPGALQRFLAERD